MKTKIILSVLVYCIIGGTIGQNLPIHLNFTAKDSSFYIQLDSIKVMNRSQGCDTILFWPDTILVLDVQTGIHNKINKKEGFQVFQNFPNPVKDQTIVNLHIPEKGNVFIRIFDKLGRSHISTERVLDRGDHSFRFTPGSGQLFIFTAYWQGISSSIKVLNTAPQRYGMSSLEYLGIYNAGSQLKSGKGKGSFLFNPGDKLLYIGYIDTLQSGILDSPETNGLFEFQFAYNIPCLGAPTIFYEEQEYHTIQIFSQCWLRENLNVGTMIPGSQAMDNNGIVEKYCYNNNVTLCDEWGGLYQWDEMMQYSSTPGIHGICPPGWHIPTDEEIKILEGSIDSQHGIGDPEWDGWDFRGLDIGYRIKSTTGWSYNGNGIDSHGFTVLSAGARFTNGTFIHSGNHAYIWSSNADEGNYAWGRLIYTFNESCRSSYNQEYGFSVRCVRDY